jgi:glycosyltransferase involved in cell wall biosynthesis
MRKQGQDIEIAALFHWPDDHSAELEARGVRIHRLNFKNHWSIFHNMRVLRRLTREGRFSIFWGHLYFGNLYAYLLALTTSRGKSVATLHSEGYSQSPPKGPKAWLYLFLERYLIGRSRAKVGVSQAVARDYEAFFGWGSIDVVHNGIMVSKNPPPPSREERLRIRASLGVTEDEFLVVVPARFVQKKGHAVLLDALAILKRDKKWLPRLAMFGEETPLLPSIRAKAEQLGLADHISFSNTIRQSALFAIMQVAEVVCIPSLREPFGIAAAEAMSLGVSVILTATDGFLELIGDSKSALMVPPGDPVALADALWTLNQRPELRKELAERAESRSKSCFDISICATRWANVLDCVAREPSHPREAPQVRLSP